MLVELFATHLRKRREKKNGLGNILPSAVPSLHQQLKKFELQGKISLRQLLLPWQCLDDLNNLYAVVDPKKPISLVYQEPLKRYYKMNFKLTWKTTTIKHNQTSCRNSWF